MTKKDLFISSVRMISIDGDKTIPTIVAYEEGKVYFGLEALEKAAEGARLYDNFKIELGLSSPSEQIKLKTYRSPRRSPIGLAKDFFTQTLIEVTHELEKNGYKLPTRILIAEPLSLSKTHEVSDSWLSNYRATVRQALHGKFETIDFMPEPFAVFQYYRYGVRHALIAQRQRHTALVIDFGGGTFDVCVIETTLEGDISQSGRNSKPLSANSINVGGFFLNERIADHLLFNALERKSEKTAARSAIDKFHSLKNSEDSSTSDLKENLQNFFENYRVLLHDIEKAKISICSSIANWRLETELSDVAAYRIKVPRSPFDRIPGYVEVRLDAAQLFSIFENRVWKQRLLDAIRSALTRAQKELYGNSISLVLLSGGSSNIRWIRHLIERDLAQELPEADILELNEDFQEVVAKGLAIECARRYYTEGEGDFRGVTYNKLCLTLNANGNGLEIPRYKSAEYFGNTSNVEPGVLLPSASSLRGFIERPLRWKTRISSPPSRYLDYHFLRSSFDPEDTKNLHNVEDSCAYTPPGTKFGKAIEIELIVRDDGTAIPRFLYRKGGDLGTEISVPGRPFFIDMTFAANDVPGDTYLGFDFGSSTSSFSFVKDDEIKVFENRSRQKGWLELNSLLHDLPYPIAWPLGMFMSQTHKTDMDKWGRETLEAMLAISAFIAFSEYCSVAEHGSQIFKGFEHRSAGPLWDMLKRVAPQIPSQTTFSVPIRKLIEGGFSEELDSAARQIAQTKHGKASKGLDYPRTLAIFGNSLAKVFNEFEMGYFEDVRPKPFSSGFEGLFRVVRGQNPPFSRIFQYEGPHAFSSERVFLLDTKKARGIDLTPLLLNGLGRLPRLNLPEMYLYDIFRRQNESFGYKAVQEDEELNINQDGEFSQLHQILIKMKNQDPFVPVIENIKLLPRV